MSYARFGCEGSDVYIYATEEGFSCCWCNLFSDDEEFTASSVAGILEHIADHRRAGNSVPDSCVTQILADCVSAECKP